MIIVIIMILRCLSVDVASVVWDLFLLDGEASQR